MPERAMQEQATPHDTLGGQRVSHVVVIGAGWAGWGAAKALVKPALV